MKDNATRLYESAIVIDGLIISKWSGPLFAEMQKAGLTAANCTCSVWENFSETVANIAQWNGWFREHGDHIVKATSVADIRNAKAAGKTAVILGMQNTSAFEDKISYVEILKTLGVGIAQMTYNTQNWVGSGCYESRDSGLSDFGHDVVAEMNRVGMLCDLSHVGPKTSRDVIDASTAPVAYSHCLPSGLKTHPRNKSDEELRYIVEKGGFVGVTMFPPFLAKGVNADISDYVAAMDYVINLVGEDAVGIGTDFTQDYGPDFFDWLNHDKGFGRKLTSFGEIINPEGFRLVRDFPNIADAMSRAGWGDAKIEKVLGLNWLALLDRVWR
ncbi:dipeptidase [Paracoccus aminophilus]|uniref:Membrane dipeptidase n=1 Tax=Paracoccus aminophilus JCM 7686 TaxID=1367847 RepID=S5YBK8_PARAH|nr:dipeptidase [Paracoccus aminophilus]AGT08838.1 membrane dipeptidase [Paracoccus aminophilus JCM 7686]